MAEHCLKIHPLYFAAVSDGIKTFEFRRNDRDYRVGDILILQEYETKNSRYTGRSVQRKVVFKTEIMDWVVCDEVHDYVVLGLGEVNG